MQKRTKVLLATVLTLGVVGSVTAYIGNHRHAMMGNHIKSHISHKLELNEAQNQILDQVAAEMIQAGILMRSKKDDTMRQIVPLLSADELDQEAARSLLSENIDSMESSGRTMIASLAQLTDSLDSAQRDKMVGLLQKRIEHQQDHHRRWGQDHNG
ncbi:MAG: periplasmic heavy metal sensor [Pseudomonadota bacterium]